MKIRQGFVSNSSSSSFVVAIEGEADTIELMVKVDLSKFANHTAESVDKLDEIIMEEYAWKGMDLQASLNDSEWLKEVYEDAKMAIEKGQRVIFGTVSNDGYEPLENFLYCEGVPESPGITIIWNVR